MHPDALQALLDRQLGRGHVHSIVTALRSDDGSVEVAAAAGVSAPGTKTKMTVESPYLLASITKMYTAAVILKTVEVGSLTLTDRLVDLLPTEMCDRLRSSPVNRSTNALGLASVCKEIPASWIPAGHPSVLRWSSSLLSASNSRPNRFESS